MVHTAMLTYRPDKALFMRFLGLEGTKKYKQMGLSINETFRDEGTLLYGRVIKKGFYIAYSLFLRVNFKRLIEKKDHTLIYKESDYAAVERCFNDLMERVGLPEFKYWKVNRIDYCFNCYTPHVKEYIKRLQKGDKSVYHHIPYNASGNYSKREGSCYYVGKSTTINFYDKEDQLQKEALYNERITKEDITAANNILRLEVQCKRPKTEYIRRCNNAKQLEEYWNGKYIDYYLTYDIAVKTIQDAIKELRAVQGYVKKKEALELIENSAYYGKTKEMLIQIVEAVAKQHSSIYKVRNDFAEKYKIDTVKFNGLLRKIESLGINVVTIPRDYPEKELAAVYDLLEESYLLECIFDNYLEYDNDFEGVE